MCIIDKYINNGIFGFIHLKASIFLSNFVEKANCEIQYLFSSCSELPNHGMNRFCGIFLSLAIILSTLKQKTIMFG